MTDFEEESNWLINLENALLEECSATDIYCICKGKPLPDNLRHEVWQICLDVRDKGNQLNNFNEIYDLPNQNVLREDCANFVAKLGNDDEDKLCVVSDLESILTFYCKSRNFSYEKDNGWLDILLPLLVLKLPKSVTYNLFEAIRDAYIPRGCNNKKNGNAFHILRLLLLYHDPELCSFLDTKRITPDQYCSAWFQSLFASTCHLPVVINMWDYYFQQSDPFFIFFLALIMVINAREQIIAMKADESERIVRTLAQMPCALNAEDVGDFCSLAQYYAIKTPATFRTELIQSYNNNEKVEPEAATFAAQALCLPVSVNELMENSANSTNGNNVDVVRFFLVDCRPAEQYNAGHLPTAFHLDCNLMLQEPNTFATAVAGLLSAQKQALALNSNAGGEHLCFLGSGRNEEDQYTHMVVASFLQKHTRYVSLLMGGYIAVHNYFGDDRLQLLHDHNANICIVCADVNETDGKRLTHPKSANTSSSTSTSGSNAIFGKLSAAMRLKSAEVKEKLFDYIVNQSNSGVTQERHVSSTDRIGKRYRNVAPVFSIDDEQDNVASVEHQDDEETREMVPLSEWIRNPDVIEHFPCQEVKLNGYMYSSHLIVTTSYLVVLREVSDKKDWAEIVVRRPLSAIVKITAKKRHPELITFKYGVPDGDSLQISDMDRFLIPNANRATKIVSEQILKLLKLQE